jgi:hypothetical protein
MLRRIAEIDWLASGDGFFVTLTYPDEVLPNTMNVRNKHRYLFNRHIEKLAGKPLASVWRVEWKRRLSGLYIGQSEPHIHILYFAYQGITKEEIRKIWHGVIHSPRKVQVDAKTVSSGSMAAVYSAKYCGKDEDATALDNVSYLNRTGRHAGWLRKGLIPMHPLEIVARIDAALVELLRARAHEILKYYDKRFDEGFTVLGDVALEIIQDFGKRHLAITGE